MREPALIAIIQLCFLKREQEIPQCGHTSCWPKHILNSSIIRQEMVKSIRQNEQYVIFSNIKNIFQVITITEKNPNILWPIRFIFSAIQFFSVMYSNWKFCTQRCALGALFPSRSVLYLIGALFKSTHRSFKNSLKQKLFFSSFPVK